MKNKTYKNLFIVLIAMILLGLPAGKSFAGTTTIIEDTVLSAGLLAGDLPIIIGANNIVLDCRGNMLNCETLGDGIIIDNKSNITIKSCSISNCFNAIEVDNVSNINILGGSYTDNILDGINAVNMKNGYIINNRINLNGTGIDLDNRSNSNFFIANEISGNSFGGVSLDDAHANFFSGNEINSNGAHGVQCDNSSNNEFVINKVRNNDDNGIDLDKCSNTTMIHNRLDENGDNGLEISNSGTCTLFYNFAEANSDDGFHIDGTSKANLFQHNFASTNGDDSFDDDTSGKKTEGRANTYEHNTCPSDPSEPAGLCDPS